MKIIPCIIGLGYVGLPIILNLANKFLPYGFDTNKERIKNLKKKIDTNKEFAPTKFNNLKKIRFTNKITLQEGVAKIGDIGSIFSVRKL